MPYGHIIYSSHTALLSQNTLPIAARLAHTVCFLQATDLARKIYTDKTGRFPVTSSRGFKYIMLAYDYDSNTIHAEPMKNCSGPELLK